MERVPPGEELDGEGAAETDRWTVYYRRERSRTGYHSWERSTAAAVRYRGHAEWVREKEKLTYNPALPILLILLTYNTF
jgi:hypothetical protein